MICLTCFLLVMALVCSPAMAGQVTGVTVDVPNEQGKFVGGNIIDGDPATAWVGGGKGIGPGKFMEFYFETPVTLESLRIHNGNQGKGQFDRFRRITKGVILYPDETRQKFTLKPSPGVQTLKLKPQTVSTFKIIITGVAPSSRDKAMGKAKVAVSEIAIFGTACEGDDCVAAEPVETPDVAETVVAKPEPVKPAPKKKAAKPAPKPAPVKKVEKRTEPVEKPVAKVKATPKKNIEPAKKIAAKPVVKPAATESEKKAEAAVSPKAAPKKKVAPKKKPARKKATKKKAAKKKTASKGAITYLRTGTPVPAGKDIKVGVIDPWLDLELVAQMKGYFALLTTLHDRYPEIFTADIRERERKIFVALQDDMREKREFNPRSIAMLEHIGLNFDKPETSGDVTTVRVHGPYRYYLVNDGYEFQVDTVFSLKKENGTWKIASVRDAN